MLSLAASIVGQFEVNLGKTRVAAVTYSNQVIIEFSFNEFLTRKDVQVAIEMIQYGGGQTNISGLMNMLAGPLFTTEYGGRSGALHVST